MRTDDDDVPTADDGSGLGDISVTVSAHNNVACLHCRLLVHVHCTADAFYPHMQHIVYRGILLAPKLVCFTSHIVKKKHYRCPDVSAKIKQCLLTCAVAVRAIIHTCNNTSHCIKHRRNCITVQATMLLPVTMRDCVLLCDIVMGTLRIRGVTVFRHVAGRWRL